MTVGVRQHRAKPIAETSQERRGTPEWAVVWSRQHRLSRAWTGVGRRGWARWKQSREGQAMTVELVRWGVDDLPVLQRANTWEMTRYFGGPESDDAIAQQHSDYLSGWETGEMRMFRVDVDGKPGGVRRVVGGSARRDAGVRGRLLHPSRLAGPRHRLDGAPRDAPPGRGAGRSAPGRGLCARRQRRVERPLRAGRVRPRGHRGVSARGRRSGNVGERLDDRRLPARPRRAHAGRRRALRRGIPRRDPLVAVLHAALVVPGALRRPVRPHVRRPRAADRRGHPAVGSRPRRRPARLAPADRTARRARSAARSASIDSGPA